MKSINKIILLGAGILLTLTGCQKGNENGGSQGGGKPVQFGAIAGAPGTRTEFSGAVTDGWERINWKDGDQVLIWSDHAVNRLDRPGKSAVYDIIDIKPQGKESHARIERAGEDGLVFLDEPSEYQFWGVYPASAVSSVPTAGELSYGIDATQTAGDMNNGVLLAYASVPGEQHVDLRFNPAFTAFSFTVAANVSMQINGLTMTSVERKNGENTFGPSVLSGSVAAKVEEGADAWTYTVPAASESNTSISTTFDDPLVLTLPEGATKTNEVTFVLFAVPADITSLTMVFNVTVDGKAETRKVTISYAKDDPNGAYAKGDPVSFAGMKKHNIKGLVLPASVNHDVVLDFQVMPWNDSEDEVTYGPDAIANAVALEYASGNANSGGTRRTSNYFADASKPIVAYFSVFAPENGTWKIKVSGATDNLTVTASQLPLAGQTTAPTVSSATVDGVLELSGPIGSRVEFKVARAAGATASDEIQLNFYAVLDGREMSINSEVTRANALTITGAVQ